MNNVTKKKYTPLPSHLILCVNALLAVFFIVDLLVNIPSALVSVLYIVVFLLPCAAYILLRGKGIYKTFNKLHLPPTASALMVVYTAAAIICFSLLYSFLPCFQEIENSFSIYDIYIGENNGMLNTALVLISFVLLPAVCEEFMFRGILCAEFQTYGMIGSITLSTFFFAIIHFNFKFIPVYIFAGIMLSLLMYATKSLYAAVLVHLLYNLFGFYGQPSLTSLYEATGSTAMFVLLLLVLLIISLILFCGKAIKFYFSYSERAAENKMKIIDKTFRSPRIIFTEILNFLRTPTALISIVIYIIAASLNLVL